MVTVSANQFIDAQPITPNDGADLPKTNCCGFIPGSDGKLRVTTDVGNTVTLTVTAGHLYQIAISRVWATDTSATDVMALYRS